MTAAAPPTVEAALEACARLTRSKARNFYHGLRLAPEPKRSALYALYAWMRAADDIVDEALPHEHDAASRKLDEFERDTERALSGSPPASSPVWPALAFTASRFPLERDDLRAMIQGQRMDLHFHQPADFAALRRYCECVASSVGLACISIFGYRGSAARKHAIERGIALQLTNILRDFSEDADRGRTYLPADAFARHDLTPEDLRRWASTSACEAMIREQCALACSFYDASRPLEGMIDADCRPVLWAMTAMYRALLAKIEPCPASIVARGRVRLGAWRKAMIVVQARRRAGTWNTMETAR